MEKPVLVENCNLLFIFKNCPETESWNVASDIKTVCFITLFYTLQL